MVRNLDTYIQYQPTAVDPKLRIPSQIFRQYQILQSFGIDA